MTYTLSKTSLNGKTNIKETGGVPFAGIGIETGAFIGTLYKNVNLKNEEENDIVIMPLISICESGMQASKIFENLKKDKVRFNNLAVEIQKQKVMDKASLQEFISKSLESEEVKESTSLEQNKRLAFNNGIFKANDNWNNN